MRSEKADEVLDKMRDIDIARQEIAEDRCRKFATGATRDSDKDKPDYSGYLSPIVIKRYGQYMLKHQQQSDGSMRGAANWKAGIPKEEYLKSGMRHFLDWWLEGEGYHSRDGLQEAICGLMFNAMGFLHEILKEEENGK